MRVQLCLERFEGLLLKTEILPSRGKAFLSRPIASLRLFQVSVLTQLTLAVQPFQGASGVDNFSIALIKVFARLPRGYCRVLPDCRRPAKVPPTFLREEEAS